MKIHFAKFSGLVITPTKGTEDSTGFDLYSVENVSTLSNSIKLIKTDIGFKISRGYFRKVFTRSSLVVRCTEIGGGVIDSRGPIVVLFFNLFDKVIEFGKGEGFCQIVFQKIANSPVLREVDNFSEDQTGKGEGSFGSTNKQKECPKFLPIVMCLSTFLKICLGTSVMA